MNKNLKMVTPFIICLAILGICIMFLVEDINQYCSETIAAPNTAGSTMTPVSLTGMTLDLYLFDANDYENPKEIRHISVEKSVFDTDLTKAINTVLEPAGLQISKALLEKASKAITIDISSDTAKSFNAGSAAGRTFTNILAGTVLHIPGVELMTVTVDGKPSVYEDHYSFSGVFKRSDTKPFYIFEESKK